MRYTIVQTGWRCSVLAMILVAALLGLGLSYKAFCGLLAGGTWPDAATMLGVSVAAGLGVKWLCEHRNELVDT